MSPDAIGLVLGLIFIAPTIYVIHTKGFDNWAWPFFLATLPVYYMLFVNPGVFKWYPAFCALVDVVVGVYLLVGGPKYGGATN